MKNVLGRRGQIGVAMGGISANSSVTANDRTDNLMLLLVLVLGGCAAFTGTPWGIGVTPDSMQYMQAAWSFARDFDLSNFSPGWPPLYPVFLAATTKLTGDILFAARCLNAVLAVASLWMVAIVARRSGWRNELVIGFLLLLTMQAGFLHIHFLMWSEPMFLVPVLLDLVLLEAVLRQPHRLSLWVGVAASTAVAIMVRYSGLALLLVNVAVLIAMRDRSVLLSQRLRQATLVSFAALLPFVGWIGFNRLRGLAATNRDLTWHPPGAEHIQMLGHTVAVWLTLPEAWGVMLFVLIAAGAGLLAWRAVVSSAPDKAMMGIVGLYLLCYVLFLAASITFADFYIPLSERILFPLVPASWMVLLELARLPKRRFLSYPLITLVFGLLAVGSISGWVDWQATRTDGLGLTSRRVQTLQIMHWLRQVPPGVRIVSNGPELLMIYQDRPSGMLPRMLNPTSRVANPGYQQELEAGTGPESVIVIFQVMAWRDYLPGPAEIERLSGTRLIYSDVDGAAWYRNARKDAASGPSAPGR